MNPRRGMTVVEVSIVVAFLLLIAAISVPALRQNVRKQRAAACAIRLDRLAQACQRFAVDRGAPPADFDALVPDYLDSVPACPSGGSYAPGRPAGAPPTCSIPGHSL